MVWDSPYILWQIVLIKQPTGQKKAFDEESNNTQGMAINQISCRSKTCLSPNWFAASPNSPPCTIWNCCSYLAVPRQKKGQGVSRTKYGEEALPIGRKNTQHAKK